MLSVVRFPVSPASSHSTQAVIDRLPPSAAAMRDAYISANADAVVTVPAAFVALYGTGLVYEPTRAQPPVSSGYRVRGVVNPAHPLGRAGITRAGPRVISINEVLLDGMDASDAQELMLSTAYPLRIAVLWKEQVEGR